MHEESWILVGKTPACLNSLSDATPTVAGPWVSIGVSPNKRKITKVKAVYTSCSVKYYTTHRWYGEANVRQLSCTSWSQDSCIVPSLDCKIYWKSFQSEAKRRRG